MEVLRRHSNNYGAVQRVERLTRHLKQQRKDRPADTPQRASYQPRKLSQRLSDETVAAMLAAYQAGATTRDVGKRFGLAHSSVNKLLKHHGVKLRRRGPGGGSRPQRLAESTPAARFRKGSTACSTAMGLSTMGQ